MAGRGQGRGGGIRRVSSIRRFCTLMLLSDCEKGDAEQREGGDPGRQARDLQEVMSAL